MKISFIPIRLREARKNHSKSVHYLKFPFFLYFLKLADKVLPYIL